MLVLEGKTFLKSKFILLSSASWEFNLRIVVQMNKTRGSRRTVKPFLSIRVLFFIAALSVPELPDWSRSLDRSLRWIVTHNRSPRPAQTDALCCFPGRYHYIKVCKKWDKFKLG